MDCLVRWLLGVMARPFGPPALPAMRLGPENSSQNPLMMQCFTWHCLHDELSWWKHVEQEIPRLAAMGFTQLWSPPPTKAMDRYGRGYDAYDLWDLGEFHQKGTVATRWGTKKDLLDAAAAARIHGVDIIVDAVLNHKLGGDKVEQFYAVPVDPNNRTREIGKVREIEGWTAFDFRGRAGKYSTFRWTHEHFTGVDWDHRTRTKGIFRIATNRHAGWSQYVDKEMGNADFLLGSDIDHRHPDVQRDLLMWGTWVLQTLGATGFRLDAAKHIDRRFLLKFIRHTREQIGMPRMCAVAECYSDKLENLLPYVRAFEGQAAFFDVPLHSNFFHASNAGSQYDLRKIFNDTLVNIRPDDALTYVDNHDTAPGQSVQSWVEKCFKLQAYALTLLRGYGHPCVFYGDLYPNRECYNEETSEGLKVLIEARKRYAYGRTIDRFVHRNCIGFVRMGDLEHPGCVVMVSNGSGTRKHTIRMNVGKRLAEKMTYKGLMGEHPQLTVSSDGWGLFTCPPSGVQVWVKDEN